MANKEKRKNKLSLEERWELDDEMYQEMEQKGKARPFQCNTCKYFRGYPKCKKFGLIPSKVMERKIDCEKYEEGEREE